VRIKISALKSKSIKIEKNYLLSQYPFLLKEVLEPLEIGEPLNLLLIEILVPNVVFAGSIAPKVQ